MNITLKDPNQCVLSEHSDEHSAKRVVIVGAEMPELKFGDIKFPETTIQKIEIPTIVVQKEVQIVEIEKQVVVIEREIEVVEIKVPIITVEYRDIIREVPVIQHEIRMVEVPVVIKEVQVKEMSNLVKVCLVVHSLTTIMLLLKLILN